MTERKRESQCSGYLLLLFFYICFVQLTRNKVDKVMPTKCTAASFLSFFLRNPLNKFVNDVHVFCYPRILLHEISCDEVAI